MSPSVPLCAFSGGTRSGHAGQLAILIRESHTDSLCPRPDTA